MLSGDREFLLEMAPTLKGLLTYFRRYENSDGLLENVNEKWNLVDWPENLRDDYDYNTAVKGVNTVLNGFYYGALIHAARIYEAIGDAERSDGCLARAGIIEKVVEDR